MDMAVIKDYILDANTGVHKLIVTLDDGQPFTVSAKLLPEESIDAMIGAVQVLSTAPVGFAYFDNGEIFDAGLQPHQHCQWSWNSKSWIDPRTLTDLQAEAWTRIKRHRDAQEFAPFTYNGNTFDGDATAQRRLASLISLSKSALSVGEPFSYPWKTAANQMVMLTAQDFVAMELAKVQQFGAAFLKAETLRGQIGAAETTEQLDAIQW